MINNWETYPHFFEEEFACRCGCGANDMDEDFIILLQKLRHQYGKPIHINSGYRCPEYNARISQTGPEGPHTTGMAIDTGVILGHDAYKLLLLAFPLGFTGIGVKMRGNLLGRFLHLDTLPKGERRPWVWSY